MIYPTVGYTGWLEFLQMTEAEYQRYLDTGEISHAEYVEREACAVEFARTFEVTPRIAKQNANEMWNRVGVPFDEQPFFW